MTAKAKFAAVGRGVRTFTTDVAEGFFEITHNSLALVGVAVVLAVAMLTMRPDLRQQGEERLTSWLTARKVAAMGIQPELGAIERATAADPRELPREQASVTQWIARKYRVAPEPVAALVDAAALLTYRAAWLRDTGAPRFTAEAAMAKMTATENAQRVIDMALQLHGGRGVEVGSKVESLYRDIRSLRIYEGATEVQQLIIGKAALQE